MHRSAYSAGPLAKAAVLLSIAGCFVSSALISRAVAPASPAPAGPVDPEIQRMATILKSLHPQEGKIALKDGIANLSLPPEFRYLDAEDSRKVLVDLWGNPPGAATGVLGMLIPQNFYSDEQHTWAATITFLDSGYIKDEDADKMDYNDLLKKMQASQEEANIAREKGGYKPLHLVGWAQAPRYDKAEKKLYWAIELQSSNTTELGLNYDIRILGRRGALVLGIISRMADLDQMNNVAPAMLATINFNEGHRYADFNPKVDKVAPYALAGLIGGGLLLAKAGGFKALLLLLGGAWKFIAAGAVAVMTFFKQKFGGGTKVNTDRPGPPTGAA